MKKMLLALLFIGFLTSCENKPVTQVSTVCKKVAVCCKTLQSVENQFDQHNQPSSPAPTVPNPMNLVEETGQILSW
jgi:hypothetical protein